MLQEPESYTAALTDAERAVIAYLEIWSDIRCGVQWTMKSFFTHMECVAIMKMTPEDRLKEIIKEYAR